MIKITFYRNFFTGADEGPIKIFNLDTLKGNKPEVSSPSLPTDIAIPLEVRKHPQRLKLQPWTDLGSLTRGELYVFVVQV